MALWIIVTLLVLIGIAQAVTWLTVLRLLTIVGEHHEKQSNVVDWISDRVQEHEEALDHLERRKGKYGN